nr:uncharacterized protein LOC123757069 [Procambarus clarkii]
MYCILTAPLLRNLVTFTSLKDLIIDRVIFIDMVDGAVLTPRFIAPVHIFLSVHSLSFVPLLLPQLFNACISGGDRTEALSFDQRIDSLVCSVTQMVVTHVSRALHPNHRLAFTTALCAAIAANEDVLKPPVWRAVLDPTTLDEHALLKAVVALETEFDNIASDLLRGARLQLILHSLVTVVMVLVTLHVVLGLILTNPMSKMFEQKLFIFLKLCDDGVRCCKEVTHDVFIFLEDFHSWVWGNRRAPPLEVVLSSAAQQGGWVLVQGAESAAVLPTLLAAMTYLASPDVKVHEDFRMVVTVGVGKETASDLTLLARPLYGPPAPTLPATLASLAALINGHNYRHHYLGSSWRRAVWQVAAAHTICAVTRYWHGHPSPVPTPCPPTLTPRTQVAVTRPSSSTPTPPPTGGKQEVEVLGWLGLDGHLNLEEVTVTWACLAKLSLERSLDDETVVQFLGLVYGRRAWWEECARTLPGEVGLVSREAALTIVSAHLTTSLPHLHNLTLDVEYRAFQEDLGAIASDIFPPPPPTADE